jgi:hypothetical protein
MPNLIISRHVSMRPWVSAFRSPAKYLITHYSQILEFCIARFQITKLIGMGGVEQCHCQKKSHNNQGYFAQPKRYDFIQSPVDLNVIIKFELS